MSVNIVAPTAQRSVCALTSLALPIACSGAMYAGVPSRAPVCVLVPLVASRSLAIPKSRTLTDPSRVRKRFCGFRSRWTIPFSLAAERTSRSPCAIASTISAGMRLPRFSQSASSVAPSRSSMTRKADPSSATSSSRTATEPGWFTVLATYPSRRKRPRMVSRIDEIRVEHLDRELLPVSMRCDVDRGHPAHTEDLVEAILSPEHAPDACFGQALDVVFERLHW